MLCTQKAQMLFSQIVKTEFKSYLSANKNGMSARISVIAVLEAALKV